MILSAPNAIENVLRWERKNNIEYAKPHYELAVHLSDEKIYKEFLSNFYKRNHFKSEKN